MFYRFLIFLSFITYSSNALSSDSNKRFTVTSGGKNYSLEEFFIKQEKMKISNVENSDILVKKHPRTFIELLLRSYPGNSFTKRFQINKLIDSLPSYSDPSEKLAGLLFEFIIWEKIGNQVENQIINQVKDQIEVPAKNQVFDLLFDKISFLDNANARSYEQKEKNRIVDQELAKAKDLVSNQVGVRSMKRVWQEVWSQIGDLLGTDGANYIMAQLRIHKPEIKTQFVNKVADHVSERFENNLQFFNFATAYEYNNLNQCLVDAIDYLLGAYQLGTIVMRHSEEFNQIQNDFAKKISNEIAQDQIEEIIAKMEIAQTRTKIYFIYSQIKMIKRHLDIEI